MKRRIAALAVLLSAASAVQAQEAPLTDLIESLCKRGVIDQEEYERYQEAKKEERAGSRVERRERALRDALDKERLAKLEAKKSWTDKIDFRGYVQFRDSAVVGGDEDIRLWNDRGVGPDTGITVRRARLIFFGQVSDNLYVYIQPDLASNAGDTSNVAQLRDFYGDISFDDKREFRVRVGQSKIPYSFEELQSSQNRLSLDRNDALNSCCTNERDLGAFFYWAPAEKRAMFSDPNRLGLKGSGDCGVIALGAYNGQGANRPERNDNMHMVASFTWPFKTEKDQCYEYGIAAINGQFSPITSGTVRSDSNYLDRRVALRGVIYPQPWGIQAEWSWGEGPELNQRTNRIEGGSLSGGYIQVMYRAEDFFGYGVVTPFVKYRNFSGAMKFQTKARPPT